MSIMQKIFSAVGVAGNTPAPATPAAPLNNKLQPAATPASPGTDNNGTIPPGNTPSQESPLDKYKGMWQPDVPDPNAPPPDTPVDPKKLMEAASKVDFSKIVSNEDMAAISGGGDDAAKTLVKLLNTTAQTVYGQNAVTTTQIVEAAVSRARDQFVAEIPNILKRQNARDAVFHENPAFNNPAIAPMVEAHAAQLATKFPKASPQELTAMSKEYFLGMANLINPPKADASSNKGTGKGEEDWSQYF